MLAQSLVIVMLWIGTPTATWQELVDARVSRDTSKLTAEQWNLDKKSHLAMQEYLLTLGQVGNPRDAARVASFFKNPRLAPSALLAYGEIDGAPTEPLFQAFDALDTKGKNIAFESICKLGDASEADRAWKLMRHLEPFDAGYFHIWRLRTDLTDQSTITMSHKLERASAGVAYYLYRGRVEVEAGVVANLIKLNRDDAQALIYTLRIPTMEPGVKQLSNTLTELVKHYDWRVGVNALNALAQIDEEAALKLAMDQRFAANPNVASNAMALLGRSASEAQHKEIARQAESVAPPQLLNAARSASPEMFREHYASLLNTWKHSGERWRRAHWVRLAANMQGPRIEDALAELAQGYDGGMASLAIQALAAGEFQNWPEVAKQVWEKASKEPDPMLMGDVAGSLTKGDSDWRPLSLDEVTQAAEKSYSDPKFHYDFINNLARQSEASELQPWLDKWADHPDYLVRLKAVTTMTDPDAARSKIYQKPWTGGNVPQELQQLAASYFNTKDKVFWELKTAKGKVTIQLQPNYAPITVANVTHLSNKGFWNNLPIHRVVPNFVVQGGDVRGDGMGGPEHIIPCEINALRYTRGAVGMALSGKDTGGSQFFICHSAQPHLDGGYTVFGYVTDGMKIVDILQEGDVIQQTRVYTK